MSSVVREDAFGRDAFGHHTFGMPELHVAETIGLMVVDHHQLFRECLASTLAEDGRFEVVAVAEEVHDALGKVAELDPNVLLVGLADGACELTLEVGRRFPKTRVLVLGLEEAEGEILACLEAGASGFVFRDQSLSELCAAIEVVARGETACTPRVAHVLFSRLAELGRERRRRERLDFLNLTSRELEILRLIADGLGNQEIAARLYLSVHTVKNHVHNILETLGVHSRWSAVRYAFEKGWLPDRRRA